MSTKAYLIVAAFLTAQGTVVAGPYSEVTSALDPGDPIDVHMTLSYGLELGRGAIKREASGYPGTDPTDPVPLVRDLVFAENRHTLVPRLELGIFTDLAITAALPVVLASSRTLGFDDQVDRNTSGTVVDGLLPATGFRAGDPAGYPAGETIFRGPTRSGLDQFHVGLVWAPMNQARDDTKPTWKLGAEARLAIGAAMKLDRALPDNQSSVGRGLHEVRVWTSIAKQMGWAEPFVEMWWMAPFAMTDDSAFVDLGYGQERPSGQQEGGARFGFEAVLMDKNRDRPAARRRVTVDVAARVEARFEGRAYSPMWEVFQYAGTQGGVLELDADPVTDGVQALDHPGVTAVENYLRFGSRLGVSAAVGQWLQVGAAFELMANQAHAIAYADAGTDLPTCGGTVTVNCEVDNDDLVDPGSVEVNPGYVQLIDSVGRRYIADELTDYAFLIDARFLF